MRNVVLAVQVLMLGCFAGGCTGEPPGGSPDGKTLYVVGVSHLDTQWWWTVRSTINEFVPTTFRDNFRLLDQNPGYILSFEGAFRYMLLKEYYPEDYRRLKSYVADGRWRLAGGWVDAADANIPSFESLTRQALYGNGFFKQEFGRTSRDVFLPDGFGFSYALPTIAAHCGFKSFSTSKLSWGCSVGIPFGIGIWEGVDGSSLVAALNPGSYGTRIKGDLTRDSAWQRAIEQQGDSSGLYAGYMYFGTGDRGGAPDSASVAWLQQSLASKGPLRVRSIGSDDLADVVAANSRADLPRYRGELLMSKHGVGCYTSQAAMKRWNRQNELLADATERAAVIADLLGGAEYPHETLKETWIKFLWHQFHDDLTGTSIPGAYEVSWNDEILCLNRFAGILENAVEVAAAALDTRVQGVPLVVYNPLSIPREDVVKASVIFPGTAPQQVSVFGPEGTEVPSQVARLAADTVELLLLARVPAVGYAVYDVRPGRSRLTTDTGLRVTASTMENERYLVRVDANGDVASIVDKSEGRELLSAPLGLHLLPDRPKQWPAWEIEHDDIMCPPTPLPAWTAATRIVENGPVRVGLEITQRMARSLFRRVVRLAAGGAGDRIEFDFDVDWYERGTLLKAAFPLTTPNDSVTYDLGLGTIQRGVNRPELYEVPAHEWADVTARSGDYGAAILNDCKYGWDHPDEHTVRLTLLHTPTVPREPSSLRHQRSQDHGHHRFTIALKGHRGDWRDAGVAWAAARLNQPLRAFQTSTHVGVLGKSLSFLSVETGLPSDDPNHVDETPSVMVNAIKVAEAGDEIIVRLRELTGRSTGDIRLRTAGPVLAAREVNGVEDSVGGATIRDGALITSLTPYQPKAFALTLGRPIGNALRRPECHPMSLPFNLDGISLDSNRRDGDFDGHGNSLAGELLPDTLIHIGVPFVFGSKQTGARNAVRCEGQGLALPRTGHNHLYMLVSAIDGPTEGIFAIDGREVRVPVQDYAGRLGQWNNRLVSGQFAESPELIAPSYILRAAVAWVGTHRHDAQGENDAYHLNYLYILHLTLPQGARTLTLPRNPRLRLLAATAVNSSRAPVRTAQPLYDVADATCVEMAAKRSIFLDRMEVPMTCPVPMARIHYTLDGSEPTTSSPAYTKPLILTQTTTVQARALRQGIDDRHVTNMTFRKVVPTESSPAQNLTAGLICAYYEGSWTRLPRFDSLSPTRKVVVSSFGFPEFVRQEDFGLVFSGYVRVPQDGLYDFYITSDDGSALYVDGTLLVDNDSREGLQAGSGVAALKSGWHPITVQVFQGKEKRGLTVAIAGPGIEQQVIPETMLSHDSSIGKP